MRALSGYGSLGDGGERCPGRTGRRCGLCRRASRDALPNDFRGRLIRAMVLSFYVLVLVALASERAGVDLGPAVAEPSSSSSVSSAPGVTSGVPSTWSER